MKPSQKWSMESASPDHDHREARDSAVSFPELVEAASNTAEDMIAHFNYLLQERANAVTAEKKAPTIARSHNLNTFTVAIVGLGRIGSSLCEVLARSGVSSLLLADKERVTCEDMVKDLYKTEYVGSSKCLAVQNELLKISSSIETGLFSSDILAKHDYKRFLSFLGSDEESSNFHNQVSIVVCCVKLPRVNTLDGPSSNC